MRIYQIQICQVACGEDFTVFLTLDGGVFTCGSGRYGQLGHGDNKDEMLPRKVVYLMKNFNLLTNGLMIFFSL